LKLAKRFAILLTIFGILMAFVVTALTFEPAWFEEAIALMEQEQDAPAWFEEVVALVEQFNQSHGGTGQLMVTRFVAWVTITGEVQNATRGLALPNTEVRWDARLHGQTQGEPLLQAETVRLLQQTDLATDGIAVQAGSISMEGGVVRGHLQLQESELWMRFERIVSAVRIENDAVLHGNIYAVGEDITVSHTAQVHAETIAGHLRVSWADARVSVINTQQLGAVRIACRDSVDFLDQIPGYILDLGGDYLTVFGEVHAGNIRIWAATLYVPEGSTLVVQRLQYSPHCRLIIEGTLIAHERVRDRDHYAMVLLVVFVIPAALVMLIIALVIVVVRCRKNKRLRKQLQRADS
jgi:cytoskeletal protein CcmA (bactofilin family)